MSDFENKVLKMEREFFEQLETGSAIEFCHWLHVQINEDKFCVIPQLTKLLKNGQSSFSGLHAICKFFKQIPDPSLHEFHQTCITSIIQRYVELGFDIDQVVDTRSPFQKYRSRFSRSLRLSRLNNFDEVTPLMLAIKENKITIVKTLIQLKCNVNKENLIGMTSLHYAVKYSTVELLTFLTESGAIIQTDISDKIIPLVYIAIDREKSYIDIVNWLIKRGVDISIKYEYPFNPLLGGYLCQCQCNPSSLMQNDSGKTTSISPLGYAFCRNKVDIAKLLLNQPNLKVSIDDVHWCLVKGHTDLAIVVLDKLTVEQIKCLPDAKIRDKYALHCLCKEAFKFLNEEVGQEEDNNEHTRQRNESIMKIQKATKDLISIYIDNGWKINCVSDFSKNQWQRNTLLSNAVVQRNNDLVTFLLGLGADPNIIITYLDELPHHTNEDWGNIRGIHHQKSWKSTVVNPTALHAAILYRNLHTVSILVNKGANIEGIFGCSTFRIILKSETEYTFSPNRSITCFEKFLTFKVDTNGVDWTQDLEFVTNYLESIQQPLDKIHLTLAVLGGNVFIISHILRFLPNDLSLENYTIFENEIPVLQYLLNMLNWPIIGDLDYSDSNYTMFWTSLTDVITQFLRRGYALNDFKPCEFAEIPVMYIAIREALRNEYRVLLDFLFETDGIDWNMKFNELYQKTPMEYALRFVHLKGARSICLWDVFEQPDINEQPGQLAFGQQCIPETYAKTLKDLMDKGALVDKQEGLIEHFYYHPCLLFESNLIEKLLWAGADSEGIINAIDSVREDHDNENDWTLPPDRLKLLSDWKEWLASERRDLPRLIHLAAIAVRRTYHPTSIAHMTEKKKGPKKLKNLVFEYTPRSYREVPDQF